MSRGERFEFEGEKLTVAQVQERVPILSRKALRDHLRAGRNSASAILCFVPRKPRPSPGNQIVIGPRGYWSYGMGGRA